MSPDDWAKKISVELDRTPTVRLNQTDPCPFHDVRPVHRPLRFEANPVSPTVLFLDFSEIEKHMVDYVVSGTHTLYGGERRSTRTYGLSRHFEAPYGEPLHWVEPPKEAWQRKDSLPSPSVPKKPSNLILNLTRRLK